MGDQKQPQVNDGEADINNFLQKYQFLKYQFPHLTRKTLKSKEKNWLESIPENILSCPKHKNAAPEIHPARQMIYIE